ncbi:MAG: hypothetical protein M1840_007270 [Geoglossum simile]|nr:MAG: hypothetical protein M1840_007270 [Geoglossum simile]
MWPKRSSHRTTSNEEQDDATSATGGLQDYSTIACEEATVVHFFRPKSAEMFGKPRLVKTPEPVKILRAVGVGAADGRGAEGPTIALKLEVELAKRGGIVVMSNCLSVEDRYSSKLE